MAYIYKINNYTFNNDSKIAYDGCHKIYVCETESEIEEARSMGYGISDFEDIKYIWEHSCPLRFISQWSNLRRIIPQCYEGTVQFNKEKIDDLVYKCSTGSFFEDRYSNLYFKSNLDRIYSVSEAMTPVGAMQGTDYWVVFYECYEDIPQFVNWGCGAEFLFKKEKDYLEEVASVIEEFENNAK